MCKDKGERGESLLGLLKFPLKWLFGARIYYVNDLLGHLDLYLHDF